MYSLKVKDKYRIFFVTFINKEEPDSKYRGMLWTAKTETAVRVKIRDQVPSNFIIKRLVEILHSVYTRLAKIYNLKEEKDIEERKKKVSTGEGMKALGSILDMMTYIQVMDPNNYYLNNKRIKK